ncbi:hypothetical protein APUTEX25_004027 [Auxenochlorella protothecoides]|uniref:Autophagy protein ATG5 alpha-helical bundle region domain-containing protein n=1 Tax=Auxenochlorella protothecoides TaxID=3075 RepID=A0A3M7L376_AUXPR|nr:hypothetical protein APUTEX25_004027 [Auxenochlorella protothecoides]|eukprot:RMZ57193.1 hypothetical protein APUTEX25_004027 [Auxenochlorella protothecoides]
MLPRVSYLYTLVPQCLARLDRYLGAGPHTPWLEFRHLPLRWQIRFSGYPLAAMPPCMPETSLKAAFLNSLKEATFILRGTAGRVMEMAAGSQTELWSAVTRADAAAYAEAAASLQLSPGSWRGRPPSLPVRILACEAGGVPGSWRGVFYSSRPVAISRGGDETEGEGEESAGPSGLSLGQALDGILREADLCERPGPEEADCSPVPSPRPYTATVCGLTPAPETSLATLYSSCAAGDGFLYVAVHLA